MFEQLSYFTSTYSEPFTVTQLTARIRRILEDAPALSDLWLEGEVSNFNRATSGHCYFTLKDAASQIRCVMWRGVADRQSYLPIDGDQVLTHGRIGVYEARGLYQLYVDQIRPAGAGDLYRQYERLKARLEAEGLFDAERKRSLPRYPRCIGVVTSPKAAALHDIVRVLGRRFPLVRVLLAPTPVQGDAAPPQIVRAIDLLNERTDVDLVIVSRGGGSLEELWAFNDERVARAIADSRIPVICGVGHETDFSLADFVADRRAPTPSAAAELAVPDRGEVLGQIEGRSDDLTRAARRAVDDRRWQLSGRVRALRHLSPSAQLIQARQRVDELTRRGEKALRHGLRIRRERLAGLRARLGGLSPDATLNRGYAIVRRTEDGVLVQSVRKVSAGDAIDVRVRDGEFPAEAI